MDKRNRSYFAILQDAECVSLIDPVSFLSFRPYKSRANDCDLLIVLSVWCGDCDQTHSVLHSAVPVCHDELVTTGKFVMDKNVTMNSVLVCLPHCVLAVCYLSSCSQQVLALNVHLIIWRKEMSSNVIANGNNCLRMKLSLQIASISPLYLWINPNSHEGICGGQQTPGLFGVR